MWAGDTLALIGATFFVAGLVKGVIGLGLPTVALAVLTATLGLKPAMALLIIPALATNAWQAAVGGGLRDIIRRMGSLLFGVCAGTWIGVRILAGSDATLLASLLGVLLAAYAVASLLKVKLRHDVGSEPWLSPAVGTVNGVLTGLTGAFAVPALLYIEAMQFPRDRFVQAIGVLFLVSTVALGLSLGGQRIMTSDLALLSGAAVLPSLAGMVAGARIRHLLSEAAFRKTFFVSLLVLGAFIAIRPFA